MRNLKMNFVHDGLFVESVDTLQAGAVTRVGNSDLWVMHTFAKTDSMVPESVVEEEFFDSFREAQQAVCAKVSMAWN